MNLIFTRNLLVTIILMLFATMAMAAAPAWKIVPNESTLTFTATQNGAPVSGAFKSFTGDIYFSPDHLKESAVNIVVDMASVSASYNEVQDALKSADWFDVKKYSQANLKANNFIKTGDKAFQATGTLTIRDKTVPVTLTFTLDNYSATAASVKGKAELKRTAFGIGQGDWAKTDNVKDEVQVNFDLKAIPK